jgi:hypothetical protein
MLHNKSSLTSTSADVTKSRMLACARGDAARSTHLVRAPAYARDASWGTNIEATMMAHHDLLSTLLAVPSNRIISLVIDHCHE